MDEETAIRLECLKLTLAWARPSSRPELAMKTADVLSEARRMSDFVISGKVDE